MFHFLSRWLYPELGFKAVHAKSKFHPQVVPRISHLAAYPYRALLRCRGQEACYLPPPINTAQSLFSEFYRFKPVGVAADCSNTGIDQDNRRLHIDQTSLPSTIGCLAFRNNRDLQAFVDATNGRHFGTLVLSVTRAVEDTIPKPEPERRPATPVTHLNAISEESVNVYNRETPSPLWGVTPAQHLNTIFEDSGDEKHRKTQRPLRPRRQGLSMEGELEYLREKKVEIREKLQNVGVVTTQGEKGHRASNSGMQVGTKGKGVDRSTFTTQVTPKGKDSDRKGATAEEGGQYVVGGLSRKGSLGKLSILRRNSKGRGIDRSKAPGMVKDQVVVQLGHKSLSEDVTSVEAPDNGFGPSNQQATSTPSSLIRNRDPSLGSKKGRKVSGIVSGLKRMASLRRTDDNSGPRASQSSLDPEIPKRTPSHGPV
ncbi:hypothetical protein GGS20DRAFT_590788 [Poronia punctata]|nr:hypothetical protein GGS20DRAFT_590788 [Poronia punctata]